MDIEHGNHSTFNRKTAPEGKNIELHAMLTIFFVILMLVGIGGMTLAVKKLLAIRELEQSGEATQGTIVKMRTWEKDEDTTYYYLQYQFEALTSQGNRQRITSSENRISGRLYNRLAIGDMVTILYSPQAPYRSYMKENTKDLYVIAVMFVGLFLIGAGGLRSDVIGLDLLQDLSRDGRSTNSHIFETWKEGDSPYIACEFDVTLLTGETIHIAGKQKVSTWDESARGLGQSVRVRYMPYKPQKKLLFFIIQPPDRTIISIHSPNERVSIVAFLHITLFLLPLLTLTRLARASIKFFVGPVMTHAFLKRSANLPIEPCGSQQLPTESQVMFSTILNELEAEGFELMSYYVLQLEPEKAISIKAYFALLRHRNRQDIAEVYWIPKPLIMLGFSSEVETKHGRITIQTTNNADIEYCSLPHKHTYRFPRVQSLHRLYRLHRAFLWKHAEEGDAFVRQERVTIQRRMYTAIKEELEAQVNADYLYRDASGTCYRPTWKGACVLTWKQMWPIQDVLKFLLKRKEKTLLTQCLSAQLDLSSRDDFPKTVSVKPLLHKTNDEYWIGACHLVNVLQKVPHAEMIRPLIEALEEPDEIVQEVAVEILGGTGLPVIELIIQIMLEEQNELLQKKAAHILRSLAVVDILILGHDEHKTVLPKPVVLSPRLPKRGKVLSKKAHIVLQNPDLSRCTTPLSGLHTIVMYPASYDLYQLERVLMSLMNALGQTYLKKHVDIEIYGDPETLHPNIRNNLTNLCKRVIKHENEKRYD